MVEAGGCAFGSKEARERNPPDAPSREVLPSGSLTGPFGLDGEEVCEPGLDRSRVGEVVSEAVMGEDRRARLRDQRTLGDRKSVVEGKSVSVRVAIGGLLTSKKQHHTASNQPSPK